MSRPAFPSARPLLLALALGAAATTVAAQQTATKPAPPKPAVKTATKAAPKPGAKPAAKAAAKPAAKPAAKAAAARPAPTKPPAASPAATRSEPRRQSAAAAASPMDADTRAIANYRLTMGVFRRMAQVQENMYEIAKANPGLKAKYAAQEKQFENEPEPKTIDEMVKRFDRVPEMKQAMQKAGISPREYFLAMMASFQAGMTLAVMEMPGAAKTPTPGVVAENIAFLKANKAEFDRMQVRTREIEREMNKLMGDDDEEEEEEEEMAEEPDTTVSRPSRR